MSTFPKIWISNACGKLFFFKDVPKDEDDDTDINCWFNNNHIEDIVDNNFNSCDWGEYEETQEIETPAGGWREDSSDSESESESVDVSDSRFHDPINK